MKSRGRAGFKLFRTAKRDGRAQGCKVKLCQTILFVFHFWPRICLDFLRDGKMQPKTVETLRTKRRGQTMRPSLYSEYGNDVANCADDETKVHIEWKTVCGDGFADDDLAYA